MPSSFLSFIFLIATFLGFLIFVALFFKNARQKHSSRLLALYILTFSLFAAHNLLVVTGLLTQFPYAFRCTKALHYLPSALLYLYVRATVKKEQSLQKKDYLLFLPCVLHFIELLPFYFTDSVTKQQQVAMFFRDMNSGLKNNEGFLPGYIHPILVFTLATVCIYYSYKLIAHSKKGLIDSGKLNVSVYKWLNLFLAFNLLLYCTLGFHICTVQFLKNYNVFLINLIETSCLLIATGITLFFHPTILYGIPIETGNQNEERLQPEQKETVNEKAEIKIDVIPLEKKLQYIQIIELKMTDLKPFLQPGFSLKDLKYITNIPYTYLSIIINQEYNLNFNEFVNKYRINYVKAILDSQESNLFTLEAISKKAGFSSRATFYRAFLKFECCSPKDYLKKVQNI